MLKKYIYIFLFVVFGGITGFLIHAALEILIINLLSLDFAKYGLGLTWQTWFTIHSIGSIILLIAGVAFGWQQGNYWWKYVYVDKKYPKRMWKEAPPSKFNAGFTLIELLIVLVIISAIASFVMATLSSARKKARDTKRKVEISQIMRALEGKCYLPNAGAGEYDFTDVLNELITTDPRYSNAFSGTLRDPKSGTALQSFYKYMVNIDGSKCIAYVNLESDKDTVTLPGVAGPSADGGTGVFEAATAGWNGTTKFYEVAN